MDGGKPARWYLSVLAEPGTHHVSDSCRNNTIHARRPTNFRENDGVCEVTQAHHCLWNWSLSRQHFSPKDEKHPSLAVERNTGTSQQEVQTRCYVMGRTQSLEEPSPSPGVCRATRHWGCFRQIPFVLCRRIPGKQSCQNFGEIFPTTFLPGTFLVHWERPVLTLPRPN